MIKRRKKYGFTTKWDGVFLIFFVAIMGGFLLYVGFFKIDKQLEKRAIVNSESQERLTAAQKEALDEGDIILRRGYGFFSDYISSFLNDAPYEVTHAGILVKINRELFVVHALSSDVSDIDGMQINSLEDFLNSSYPEKLIVCRVKNQPLALRSQIAERALYYLKLKIPFDHLGNYEDASSMYCTELIWRILEKDLGLVELPVIVKQRKAHFYSMRAMYDTNYFDLIVDQYKIRK